MNLLNKIVAGAPAFLPVLITIALVASGLFLINRILRKRWQDDPDAQFRFQLIMLALTFAGILTVIGALPVSIETRGQLLSLIGILLSAAIALSSTTFIGNIMAGIMLKVVKSARPGDFITVADLTGRITEMDLLHTEVQTEFRDLVTVPNLYMVTQPLQVVRSDGTIITTEVSLGYDVSHSDVSRILCEAASQAQLKDTFVHVRQLGDYSVSYRVAGLLEDVKSLISARSRLREAVLDALHVAGIEIVSPSFMNTRVIPDDKLFVPRPSRKTAQQETRQAEDVAFDKAEEAASAEELRNSIELVDAEIAALADSKEPDAASRKQRLTARKEWLAKRLKTAKEQLES